MIRLRFRLRPRLGCSWAPLGAPLAPFLGPKMGPDRPRSLPRSGSKMGPKINQKNIPKWDPKTEVKVAIFWAKRSTGVTVILGRLCFGGALPASWASFLRWPKSQILTPTCLKFAPKTDPRATFRPQLAPKLRLNRPRGGGFRGIYQ